MTSASKRWTSSSNDSKCDNHASLYASGCHCSCVDCTAHATRHLD
jgi:hypothetical protein